MLARDTSLFTDDVWVVDSTPVECARSRDTVHRSDLSGWAYRRECDRVVTLSSAPADEGQVWVIWLLGALVAWTVLAFLVAVVIGRSIRVADRRSPGVAAGAPLGAAADLSAARRATTPAFAA